MEVVVIEGCGGPEVFKCREEPFPIPKDDEVVIRVLATCVNKMDLWRTRSEFELPPNWNTIPGIECTGTIIGVGLDVHEWKVGDEVCALLNGGGYTEAVVVRATQVLPLPIDNVDKYQVAGLPHAACTTWEAISRIGKLSTNMTLLVYERCGKICDLAVQLAEMVQARVIIARDESTLIRKFSSNLIVDVKSPYFLDDILEETGDKRGVDIILDCVISTDWKLNAEPLRVGGTIVLVDLGPEKLSNVNLWLMYCSNAVLHVVDRMWWTPEYMAAVVLDMKKNMWPAFKNGSLVLPVAGEEKRHLLCNAALAKIGDIVCPIIWEYCHSNIDHQGLSEARYRDTNINTERVEGGTIMQVVTIEGCGGPKVFKCQEEQFPKPKDYEVVIQVLATCVNKMDLWSTRSEFELPLGWNTIPGVECAATIIGVGKDVHEWKVGDQVCALLNGGGYGKAVVVPAAQVLPLPLNKAFLYRVAGLPHAACTTWEAVSRRGKLSANMTLLVYERCGKICDLAVQLAEMVQARVIVARDESTFIKKFSHPIVDVKSPHFLKDVLKATGDKNGVDLILDCDVSIFEKGQVIPLRVGGTIVLVDLFPTEVPTVDLWGMCSANAVLHVVNRIWWSPEYHAEVVSDMKKNMWPAFSNGSLVLPEVGKPKSQNVYLTPAFSNGWYSLKVLENGIT